MLFKNAVNLNYPRINDSVFSPHVLQQRLRSVLFNFCQFVNSNISHLISNYISFHKLAISLNFFSLEILFSI